MENRKNSIIGPPLCIKCKQQAMKNQVIKVIIKELEKYYQFTIENRKSFKRM